jgi:hypothetical protein
MRVFRLCQYEKLPASSENVCVDQVSPVVIDGSAGDHSVIVSSFSQPGRELVGAVRPVPRPSLFNIPLRQIVMPLLLQNRSNQVYRAVPQPGREASGPRGESTRENESRHFLQPAGVLLLAVTVAAAIARRQKSAALSTAYRCDRLFLHRYAMMMEPTEIRENYGICSRN